jgi:hypothetical protein
MKARYIRISLIAASIAAVSTGALAHEENLEAGPYDWIQHLWEAKAAPKGVAGHVRSDTNPSSVSSSAGTAPTSQPVASPLPASDGIGRKGTN